MRRDSQKQMTAPKLFQEKRRGQHPPKVDAYSHLESMKPSQTDIVKKGKGLRKLEKEREDLKSP